jgi:hypothetical protein
LCGSHQCGPEVQAPAVASAAANLIAWADVAMSLSALFNIGYGEAASRENDRRSIRTLPRALVEQRRAGFTSSVAALRAALSAENGFEISAASLRL